MKRQTLLLALIASLLSQGHLSASVPLRWTVETSAANPATFDQFSGATYDLEAALQSRGKPLAVEGEAKLYWQTNGMGSAWWTAPATVSGNVLRATWTPACDVGARVYNCFIGITGTTYNAAFQLRLRPSPGAVPNEMPLPQKVIDFSQVTVINPPWPSGAARPLPQYLHVIDYYGTYPEDAAWYYSQPQDYGSCSAVRDGNTLSRNYDWKYDDAAEFVVRMSAGPGRLSSVGVANCGTNLTESFVTSGKSSRYYKCLPGRTVDGINEKGVSVEVNVVDGYPKWRSGVLTASDIHPLAAVRWVLDNGTSAGMAASNLAARIKFPSGWSQNFHWMLADSAQTWIVENGACSNITGRAVMTNFPLMPTPTYGAGWERYMLLQDSFANITNAWYTRAYSRDTEWISEFSDITEMEAAKSVWETYGREKLRGKGLWQTVHTSIYDLENRILRIAVQETDDWYTFSVPSSVTPEDLAAKRDKTDLDVEINVPATDWEITYNPSGWSGDWAVQWTIDPFGSENVGWVLVDLNGYVSEILSTNPYAVSITDTVYWAWSPGFGVSRTIAHVEHDRLATTNDLAAVIGESTNAAIHAVSRAFRRLHDEHVYVPSAMGPFNYEADDFPGLVDAIGDRQPEEYSYGSDYSEYYLYFPYDDYDVNAYGYGKTTDDIINFNGYGYRYDPATGDYEVINVYFVGRREAGEWIKTSDTFARESAITQVRSDVIQIRNMIGGETKVMRQDGEFEYGSGWGYVRQVMDSDRRMWRIRVPKWTGVAGMTTNAMDTATSYFVRTNGNYHYCTPSSPYPNAVMQNVISWYAGWGLDRKLVTTAGISGSDGTAYADYRIGIFYRDADNSKRCAIEYDVTQTATAPMSFKVKPVTDGLQTTRSCRSLGNNTQYSFGIRYLDLPDFSRTWSQTYSSTYSFDITLTVHVIGLMVEKDADVQTTNGTIPLTYWLLCDCTWHIVRHNLSTGVDETFDKAEDEVVIPWTVTVTANSYSTMEDLIVPYYRLLSTRDPNLYYDHLLDETYRISVSNGCFYSEKFMDGDWRKAE